MLAGEFEESVRGGGKFFRVGAPFREGEGCASCREWRGVLQEFREGGNGAGGHELGGIAERATARLFGPDRVDLDVMESEFGGDGFEEPGALLERFDQVNRGFGPKDRDHQSGVAAATADIGDDGGATVEFFGDAQKFDGFGVVSLHHGSRFDRGHPRVDRGSGNQPFVAFEQGEPAGGIIERREERGEIIPLEIQGTPRSTITLRMIQ